MNKTVSENRDSHRSSLVFKSPKNNNKKDDLTHLQQPQPAPEYLSQPVLFPKEKSLRKTKMLQLITLNDFERLTQAPLMFSAELNITSAEHHQLLLSSVALLRTIKLQLISSKAPLAEAWPL